MKVLLVGLGRMGQRYGRVIKELLGSDTKFHAVDPLSSSIEGITVVPSLDQVAPGNFDIGIDCHPNEQRLEIFKFFLNRGIKKVIIEKPLASSWSEAIAISSLAQQKGVQVFSPFYNRYSDHFSETTLKSLDAGALLTVSISGGALGIGCNGIHYLDLCSYLFGTIPLSVFSTLSLDSLDSPRGKQFKDHGGLVTLEYPNGRATIDFSSQSSMGLCMHLVFERGRIIVHDQANSQWFWYRQPNELNGQPLYRTSNEVSVSAPVPYGMGLEPLMKRALPDFLEGGRAFPGILDGLNALRAIGLAMASNTLERTVRWDEDELLEKMKFGFT